MKTYWDSSALVAASANLTLRTRLHTEGGVTRTHALAETFSALTGGNLALRVDADAAARMVGSLAQDLDFVDLTSKEVLEALKQAWPDLSSAVLIDLHLEEFRASQWREAKIENTFFLGCHFDGFESQLLLAEKS